MTRSANPLFAILAFGNFIIGMGAFVVVGIVTPIAEGLSISKSAAGVVLTAYAFAYAIASPIAVALTGRMARRTVLVAALALFCLGSVLSALAPSLALLAASRVIVALGGALFTPVAAGVAVALSEPSRRGRALAVVFGGLTLAQVIGVPLGAWLAYRHGWQSTFWAVALLSFAGIATLFYAVPRDVHFQPSPPAAILGLLARPSTLFAIAFTASFIAAIYIVFTYFGPLIEQSLGPDPELRTLYLVLFGIGAVLGNFAGGFLTDRIGGFRTLALLCLGQALVMPAFSFGPWGLLAFAILVGGWSMFGWSFMAAQQTRLVAIAADAQALALALNAAMIYVGIAVGSGIATATLGWGGLEVLGLLGGLGALVALAHLIASERWARHAA